MAYNSSVPRKMIKRTLPIKLTRKAMLNKTVIKSYDTKNMLKPSTILKLQKHSKIHTVAHIKMMVNKMTRLGYSFSKAHQATMAKLGK